MQTPSSVPADVAAEHYVDGFRRGELAERQRVLRILKAEIETTSNLAHKNGIEHSREHAAVMVKLGLLFEMVAN
jgi:hypothetical protein